MVYAIFGDSYISRLNHFTKGHISSNFECNVFGVPGMSTRNKFADCYEKLLSSRPRYVFVVLGGNNINYKCRPNDVVEDIKWLVTDMKRNGVERVFISEIIERGKFPTWTKNTLARN